MSASLLSRLLAAQPSAASTEDAWWSVTVTADVAVEVPASSRWWLDRDGVYFPTAGVWVSSSTRGLRADVAVPNGAGVLLARPSAPVAWTSLHGASFRGQVGVVATDAAGEPVSFISWSVDELKPVADDDDELSWFSPLVQVFCYGVMVAQGMAADPDAHVPADGGFAIPGLLQGHLREADLWKAGFDLELWELPALLLKQLGVPASRVTY